MRRIILFTVSMLIAVATSAANADDSPESRLAAANRYMAVVGFQDFLDASLRAGLRETPENQREKAFALVKSHLDYERISKILVTGMAKHFTTQELNALAAFYGSPEGRSAVAKFPALSADTMPALQSEVQAAVAGIKAEVAAKGGLSTGDPIPH